MGEVGLWNRFFFFDSLFFFWSRRRSNQNPKLGGKRKGQGARDESREGKQ